MATNAARCGRTQPEGFEFTAKTTFTSATLLCHIWHIIHAESVLYWGSKVHPEMGGATKKIRELIESGAIRDEKQHRRYVNALLELMRVPKFTQWATIETGYDGKPVAMRLTN